MVDSSLRAKAFVTRFLLPFRFDANRTADLKAAVEAAGWCNRPPHAGFLSELLPEFTETYLGAIEQSNYYQLSLPLSQRTPGHSLVFINPRPKLETLVGAVLQPQDGRGIELFLAGPGVALLSITLTALRVPDDGIQLSAIREFNYSLAQPEAESTLQFRRRGDNDAPPQSLQSVCYSLLQPIVSRGVDLRPLRRDALLVPYTVVRFPQNVAISSLNAPSGTPAADDLVGQASLLAQVDEAAHPLPIREDPGVPVRVFHTDELAAVSGMGAAIFVFDVGTQFDTAKPATRRDKYFIAFLAALVQRLRLMQLSEEANHLLDCPPAQIDRALALLRRDTVRTLVSGSFVEISTRDAVNRFFTLCQQGQRVRESLALVQQTIADLDSSLQAERQGGMLAVLAETQNKVEWIEVFLISFYSAELTHLLGDSFGLAHGYLGVVALGAMLIGGLVAAMMIRPWAHESNRPPSQFWIASGITIGILVAFLLIGSRWYPAHGSPQLEEIRVELEDLRHDLQKALRPPEPAGNKVEVQKNVPTKPLSNHP